MNSQRLKTGFQSVFAATVLALPLVVAAQETEEDLLMSFGEEEFVSIATGQKQLISKAPAVASVITADQIAAMGANNLDEVLATVPGLHVSLSSTYLSSIYSIRGIHTDKNPQVLMLVNGVPITHLHFGDRGSRNLLPIHDIERVEVIRGPGSAVYGADAFAGVINIETRSADDINGTETGVRFGSFDTSEAWLLHGGKNDSLSYALSIQAMQTDGDNSRRVSSDAQSVFDAALAPFLGPFGIPPASLAPGSLETREERLDIRLELEFHDVTLRAWHAIQDDVGVGPGLALALDPGGSAKAETTLIDATWSNDEIFEHTQGEVRLAWMDLDTKTRQTLFPAGAVLPVDPSGNLSLNFNPLQDQLMLFTDGMIGNPEFYEEHWRLDASLLYSGYTGHRLRLAGGLTYQEEKARESKNFGPGVLDLASRTQRIPPCLPEFPLCQVSGEVVSVTNTPWIFMNDQDRTVWYVSTQDQWHFARDWDLTLGLRYDHYSDFGSTWNPRIALVWDATQKLTSKVLYGRAFRAPSFAELFAINNPVALGNENLDPEIINTVELAFDYRYSFDLRTGFNLFWYEIDDLIEFTPSETGGLEARNIGGQNGYGFELEANWEPRPDFSVIANYAWQNGEDDRTHDDVGLTPEHQVYVRGQWEPAPAWRVSADWRWIGSRDRSFGDPRKKVDDYNWANLTVGYVIPGARIDLTLQVRNVFDETAREPSPSVLIPDDFALEERSFHFSLKYKF